MRQFGAGSPIAIKPESVAGTPALRVCPTKGCCGQGQFFMSVSTVCIVVHVFSWLWTAAPEIQNGFQVYKNKTEIEGEGMMMIHHGL